jgi:hypothetical protein
VGKFVKKLLAGRFISVRHIREKAQSDEKAGFSGSN